MSNDEDSYVDVENDDDSTSNSSIISDSSKGFCHNDNTQDIPDITNWDKNQVYNYLLHHLPQDLVEQLYLKVNFYFYYYNIIQNNNKKNILNIYIIY